MRRRKKQIGITYPSDEERQMARGEAQDKLNWLTRHNKDPFFCKVLKYEDYSYRIQFIGREDREVITTEEISSSHINDLNPETKFTPDFLQELFDRIRRGVTEK